MNEQNLIPNEKGKRRVGRPKGTPNKVTQTIKEMLMAALDEVGGREYFIEQAKENPTAFMTLLGKALPKDVKADVEHSGSIGVQIYIPSNGRES